MKKKILFAVIIILLLGGVAYLYIDQMISTGFRIDKTVYIEINEQKDYQDVILQLEEKALIEDISNFKHLATFLKYPDNIKSGRYAIKPAMNVLDVIKLLKSGNQTPLKLTFNNIRTKKDLAGRLSDQLMFTNKELLDVLNNRLICERYGFDTATIVCMFIPNTYEVYWNVSLEKFLERMQNEHKKFWNESRISKANQMELTQIEVSVLASIVEEECYFSDEYPVVAGLYINRLKKGQLLQADPTVKFALKDFTLRRVLNKHLETDSPYNTYKYKGLPPGPIRIPNIKALDAVLNYSHHNFYYMCAKEDFSGRHNFARTHAEHQRNASRYQAALNKRRIYQ